jgi:hypothetical protein
MPAREVLVVSDVLLCIVPGVLRLCQELLNILCFEKGHSAVRSTSMLVGFVPLPIPQDLSHLSIWGAFPTPRLIPGAPTCGFHSVGAPTFGWVPSEIFPDDIEGGSLGITDVRVSRA